MDLDHFFEWRVGCIKRTLAAVEKRIVARRQEQISQTLRGMDADMKIDGYCGAWGHRRLDLDGQEQRFR